jgi:hypothetical protein
MIVLTEERYEALPPHRRVLWKGYTYRIAYETWDEESLEIGETDDKGWEVEDGGSYEHLEGLLKTIRADANWLEWSASKPYAGCWIISEGETNFSTGEVTNYSLFIERLDKEPLSFIEMQLIGKVLGIR